jgi:hypothetical protein
MQGEGQRHGDRQWVAGGRGEEEEEVVEDEEVVEEEVGGGRCSHEVEQECVCECKGDLQIE